MEPMSPNSWLGKSHFETLFHDAKLNGTLDEFRIYNRVLSATEIADLAAPQRDYSYFRFNETTGTSAKDSSDKAIVATASDVTWTTGRLGGAVKLAGAQPGTTGPHISLATSPLAGCSEFTVSVWIKPDIGFISGRIFDFGTGTDSIYLSLGDGAGMQFGMSAPGKTPFTLAASTTALEDDGRWHHVAVTLLSSTARIYVDGTQKAVATNASIKPIDLGATTQNWIGKSRVDTDRYMKGDVDELRIACRAYTPDEIINLSRP
jgi:hypothetical protein